LSDGSFELNSLLAVVEGGISGTSSDSDSKPHDGDSGVGQYFLGITKVFGKLEVVFVSNEDIIKENVSVLHESKG
jgi:hypothetical protein